MAFIEEDVLNPKKKPEDDPQASFISKDSTISGQSEAAPTQSAQAPGTFATVNKYVDVNKPQAEQLATKIAEGVSGVANQAQTDIGGAKQSLESQIAAGTPESNPDIVNKAVTAPTTLSQADIEAFNKQKNALYTGPTDVSTTPEYLKAQQALDKARQTQQLIGTESGQKELLAEQQKTKAQGITDLNQALLSMAPGAREKLASTNQSFSNLDTFLKGLAPETPPTDNTTPAPTGPITNVGDILTKAEAPKIANAQSLAESSRNFATTQVGQALDKLVGGLNDKLQQGILDRNQYNDELTKLLPTMQKVVSTPNHLITDPAPVLNGVLNSLWLSPYQRDKNSAALAKYFTPPTTDPSQFDPWKTLTIISAYPEMANVISSQDIATAKALAALIDQQSTLPATPGEPLKIPNIPEGLQDLTQKYIDDNKRADNMRDIALMFDSSGGPTDPLRSVVNTPVQDIAKTMMNYINRFGAGYYPHLSGEKVAAIQRIANGSLDPNLYK